MRMDGQAAYRERNHPNSASCRLVFRVVNYSMPCHLGWPFWGQNNLGFSCTRLCSIRCPYQSCYKRHPCASHTHLQPHGKVPTMHFTLLTVCLLPERFFLFFNISGDFFWLFSIKLKTVLPPEDKTNCSFTTLIFFNLSQPLSRVFLSCFALVFSAVTENVQVEYRRETAGKVAFICSQFPQCHTCCSSLHQFLPNASDAAFSGLKPTWISPFICLFLSFKEQRPSKFANTVTKSLLWSGDSLMQGFLDWTHICSYEKAGFKFMKNNSFRITPGQNLEQHISAHPQIKLYPGATEKQGCVKGESHAILLHY